MKNKSLYVIAFILIVLAQWLVPGQMISGQEEVLATGKILKFKTAPVDPYDAFRGKYVFLSYENNKATVTDETRKLDYNDDVFVTFKDSAGYAVIQSVTVDKPETTSVYVKAKIDYVDNRAALKHLDFVNTDTKLFVYVNYPFDRFYMNEAKAPKAEQAYRKNNSQLQNNAYAQIAIKNGVGVVKDVIIDGKPIKEYVK